MKLDSLVLHDATRSFLNAYIRQPKQGILLAGPVGCGLYTTAHALAENSAVHSANIMTVAPDEKGTISIERVRALYAETRSIRSERFFVIIDDSETMRHEAQNAFLKLLEEPTDNVFFILTSHEPSRLLSTILSRVQKVDIQEITATASESLLRAHHVTQPTVLQQMLFIARGLPAELIRLAESKDYFESRARYVRLARDFLTARSYDRLTLISQISGRGEALDFVATVASVLGFTAAHDRTAASTVPATVLETVAGRLNGNGHVRTQLMYLALNVV